MSNASSPKSGDDPSSPVPPKDTRRERLPKPVPSGARLHWRIHYADGRTVGSHQSTWEAAPRENVVAVVQALDNENPDVQLGTPYYWHFGDWICRVWDVTLYLRQSGLVKFGRWAPHKDFQDAWTHALHHITPNGEPITDEMLQCGCVSQRKAVDNDERGIGFAVYYDDGTVHKHTSSTWNNLPTDGVLCMVYSCVYSGLKLTFAIRRYTYYFWRGHELINTDDLSEVLLQFPECKLGVPSFYGKSYRTQAEAIKAALEDTLDDVRTETRAVVYGDGTPA